MTNGHNVARSRHLEELARAAKRYTLQEILDVTEAVAAELGGLSSTTYDDFTGATSITGGLSGLVPAPEAGDEEKFLRGDGSWATVESGSASVVDFTGANPIKGGTSGLVPAPQAGDNGKFLRGDGSWATVPSGSVEVVSGGSIGVLDTVPATVDGGFWYEVSGTNVILNLRLGDYAYQFNRDSLKFVGDTSGTLIAYLPFNVSPTEDYRGNEWTATGNPQIVDGALSLDGSSYVTNSTISDSLGARTLQPWTIDFWATATSSSTYNGFFGTFNALNPNAAGQWISVSWNGGNPLINFYSNDHVVNLNLQLNTRHHYALTYDGTNVYFFVDGVLGKTLTLPVQLGGDFVIGTRPDKGFSFIGTIDHFRILAGALWTEDFTPPTANDYL